ncbi:hypothetical protein VTO42DRAFT_1771 [Malbranchea cinnamomea]
MSTPAERYIPGLPRANPTSLPPEKVFSIQIGTELFRLSGASISSDAPSYFSQFFEEQLRQNEGSAVRTLYIDRDPATFKDICLHLQGYHVRPRDGQHFVKLFADAQFYSLPRLTSQLFESDIFIQIGERHFEISRDVFSGPGDSPNFFSLGFTMFFSRPEELFPGLDRSAILRPPAIVPPMVSNRSGETFAELLHMLRGYPIRIRDEEHRAELLRDCRYYHLRGLEQKLIPHHISYNFERQSTEIVLRLEDLKASGVKLCEPDPSSTTVCGRWVLYSRPFVDDTTHELIVEIGGESMALDLNTMQAELYGSTRTRLSKLTEVVAKCLKPPPNAPGQSSTSSGGSTSQSVSPPGGTSASLERIRVRFDKDSAIELDGREFPKDWSNPPSAGRSPSSAQTATDEPPRKRPRDSEPEDRSWVIRNGQWRLQLVPRPMHREASVGSILPGPTRTNSEPMELVLVAVKVDAMTSQRVRNARRGFLVH